MSTKQNNIFQSTLPREERRFNQFLLLTQKDFNPRSHERSDKSTYNSFCPRLLISIHAPTRGATNTRTVVIVVLDISIHAPTRGATIINDSDAERLSISIHAPTRGATDTQTYVKVINIISIHAPTRGATEKRCIKWII